MLHNTLAKRHILKFPKQRNCYIPVLIASTGSNLDAEIAGITPDINPIKEERPKPKKMFENDSTKEKSSTTVLAIKDTIQTITTPINPPRSDKITASNKN